MFLALAAVGLLRCSRCAGCKWLLLVFILPWAVPAIPTFISGHWMLNGQWGLINNIIWDCSGPIRPGLADRPAACRWRSVIVFYIWKWLPFWTVIFLAGRTAIPTDLYEAAAHRRRARRCSASATSPSR